MSKAISFSEADQVLLVAVLKQIEGIKVDYEILRRELNLPTKGSAQVRWSRFNSKLKKAAGGSNGDHDSLNNGIAGGGARAGGSPTKRAMKEEDMDVELTPRRMPAREKRAKNFNLEVSGDEDMEVLDDSELGGTPYESGGRGP
jgi:hypothetical protein